MDLGLSGKKAIITGSTRGIGRAIANLLADEGVDLAICSRNQEEVDSTISELSAKGVKVVGSVVDVADKDTYQNWIADMAKQLGGIDIFVPNVSAGGGGLLRGTLCVEDESRSVTGCHCRRNDQYPGLEKCERTGQQQHPFAGLCGYLYVFQRVPHSGWCGDGCYVRPVFADFALTRPAAQRPVKGDIGEPDFVGLVVTLQAK